MDSIKIEYEISILSLCNYETVIHKLICSDVGQAIINCSSSL